MKRPTERFARRTVATTVALVSLVAFAALAGVGLSQVVTSAPQDQTLPGSTSTTLGSTTDQAGSTTTANGKFIICHKTHSKKHPAHTITVAPAAWPAHKAQGDHMGACTDAEMHPSTTTTSTNGTTTSGESQQGGKDKSKSKPKHKASHKNHGGGHGHGK